MRKIASLPAVLKRYNVFALHQKPICKAAGSNKDPVLISLKINIPNFIFTSIF